VVIECTKRPNKEQQKNHLAECSWQQSVPLAAVTPEVMQQFAALHPYEDAAQIPPTDVPPICITAEILSAVLTCLRGGTAPGLTGWAYEHILGEIRRPSALRACIAFLNNMLAGRQPHVPELLDSDGLPLRKPVGGIRPIAIGEAWLRLAALCPVHECNGLGPSLAPLQLSVIISGGAERVDDALRSAPHSNPDHLLLSLDCKHAFNSISRQAIFHATQEHAPVLLPFLSWAYSSVASFPPRGATRLLPIPLHQRREAGRPARAPPDRPHPSRTK
jgi:hypothetical protein